MFRDPICDDLFSSMAYPTSGRTPIGGRRWPIGITIGMAYPSAERGICRTVITVRRPGPCSLECTV